MSDELNKPGTVYFSAQEVAKLLKITRTELRQVLRPIRTKNGNEPPLFSPEAFPQKLAGMNWVFTQRDIVKLSNYFKAWKAYKEAREALKKKP